MPVSLPIAWPIPLLAPVTAAILDWTAIVCCILQVVLTRRARRHVCHPAGPVVAVTKLIDVIDVRTAGAAERREWMGYAPPDVCYWQSVLPEMIRLPQKHETVFF